MFRRVFVANIWRITLLIFSLTAFGQNEQAPSKADLPNTKPSQGASEDGTSSGSNRFTGNVHDESYLGLAGALVTIRRTDRPTMQVQTFTDPGSDSGHYDSPSLPLGTYDLIFQKSKYEPTAIVRRELKEGAPQTVDVTLIKETSSKPGPLWGLALAFLFLASIYFARWHNIAAPTRKSLISRIEDVQVRAEHAHLVDARKEQLALAKKRLAGPNWGMARDFLFWSQGQENAVWATIHFAEMEILDKYPLAPERVTARLNTAQQQLAASDDARDKALSERIKQAFDCKEPVTSAAALRELQFEVQYYLYNANDSNFAQLTSWQNKAAWLTLVGLMIIVVLAYAADHWALFVAGAAGGFLSRMSKQLKRADVPSDYGASWTTLFLSPVLGALLGWFGVLLVAFASDPDFGLVGGPLKQITWTDPFAPGTLFGAFLLGFSERLFDGLVSKLEAQIDAKQQASKKIQETSIISSRSGPEITNLKPAEGSPGTSVMATLASLDSAKVQSLAFLTEAGPVGADVSISTRPDSKSFSFQVPSIAPGQYGIRLLAPTPADAGVGFHVLGGLAVLTTTPLPDATQGVLYEQKLQASGGVQPYTWRSKGLPTWANLAESSGLLSGTPASATPATKFSVTVEDNIGASVSVDFDLTVR
jgi:Putative Ig domain/Carboxypeptidase regulatory-like domain